MRTMGANPTPYVQSFTPIPNSNYGQQQRPSVIIIKGKNVQFS